jgi:hypothetical protein
VSKQKRTLFELTTEELQTAVETGKFPDDLTWEGLEDHPMFATLFRHRHNPSKLASSLLKERGISPSRGVSYKPTIPAEVRLKKLELREKEIALAEKRLTKYTELHKMLSEVKKDVNMLLKVTTKLVEYLKEKELNETNHVQRK